MKYTIDGKPAYLVAKQKGITIQTFYNRVKRMSIQDAVLKGSLRARRKYIIKKGGRRVTICFTTRQVADFFGMTKGAICGLFFRQGDKISIAGHTCTRYPKGGMNETTESI